MRNFTREEGVSICRAISDLADEVGEDGLVDWFDDHVEITFGRAKFCIVYNEVLKGQGG